MLLSLVPAAGHAIAQEPQPSAAMVLVLDASGSMNGDDGSGSRKIDSAKRALDGLVEALPAGAPVGLRVYGHRVSNNDKANGCRDTELVAPVAPLDRARMHAAIGAFAAKGFTPIGLSLREAAADLPSATQRTVVLVSDGVDTCAPPDPCDVARELAASGVSLKIETVGFQVDAGARDQLRCIAGATGGTYVGAGDAASLARELSAIAARALRTYKPVGIPVSGGPTMGTAELVGRGQHLFSLPLGDERWFAVRLDEGQTLSASLTLPGEAEFSHTSNWRRPQFAVVTPAGDRADYAIVRLGGTPDTGRVTIGPVDTADVYYLRVTDERTAIRPGVAFDAELVIDVTGEPPPPPSTRPASQGGETATRRPEAAQQGKGSTGRAANGALGALAGLLVGSAAAVIATRRRPA